MTVEAETLKFCHKRLKSIIHLMVRYTTSIMKKAEIWLTRKKKIFFLDLDFPLSTMFLPAKSSHFLPDVSFIIIKELIAS